MKTKICSKCRAEKELIEFSKSKHYTGGYDVYCKDCRWAYNHQYQQRNREGLNEYRRHRDQSLKIPCPQCGNLMGRASSLCVRCSNKVLGKRLAESRKEWWSDDLDGKKRQAASDRLKARWEDPTYRQKMLETNEELHEQQRGQPLSNEHRLRVSEGVKKAWAEGKWDNRNYNEESKRKKSESIKQLWQDGHYDHIREENSRKLKQWAWERSLPKIAAQALADAALSLLFSKTGVECRLCGLKRWPHELGVKDHLCKGCRRKLRDEREWLLAHEQKRCSKCLEIKSLTDFQRHKPWGWDSSCKTCKKKDYKPHPKEVESFIPDGTKICGSCGKEKPYSEFHKDSRQEDGYRWQCKNCIKTYDTIRKEQRHEGYLRLKEEKNHCPDCGVPISPWVHREDQRCPKCAARQRLGENRPQPPLPRHYHLTKDLISKEPGTALEYSLAQALDDLGLGHITRRSLPDCPYVYDEYVPELNLLIEADGEYWHFSERAQEQGIPENDTQKDQWAIDHDYRIIRVRERDSDFKGMKACLAEQLFSQLEF